jgi:hypothetical protein
LTVKGRVGRGRVGQNDRVIVFLKKIIKGRKNPLWKAGKRELEN